MKEQHGCDALHVRTGITALLLDNLVPGASHLTSLNPGLFFHQLAQLLRV